MNDDFKKNCYNLLRYNGAKAAEARKRINTYMDKPDALCDLGALAEAIVEESASITAMRTVVIKYMNRRQDEDTEALRHDREGRN